MKEQPEAPRALMVDAEEPLVLAGPPRALRGEFRLRNASAEKFSVRDAVFRSVAAAPPTGRGKRAAAAAPTPAVLPEAGLVMRRIVMRPGQLRPVPVALELDPNTPPGTYHAELMVNDQLRKVVMHVTEEFSLQISPEEIVLENRPGETLERTVVFTNLGNVDVQVRSLGTVVLDEELVHCRALRGALSDVGDTMKTLDDFAAALGKRYKKLYETLVLKVKNDAVTVGRGQTVAVTFQITMPEKLEVRSRYTGYAAISTSSLVFTIVPD